MVAVKSSAYIQVAYCLRCCLSLPIMQCRYAVVKICSVIC